MNILRDSLLACVACIVASTAFADEIDNQGNAGLDLTIAIMDENQSPDQFVRDISLPTSAGVISDLSVNSMQKDMVSGRAEADNVSAVAAQSIADSISIGGKSDVSKDIVDKLRHDAPILNLVPTGAKITGDMVSGLTASNPASGATGSISTIAGGTSTGSGSVSTGTGTTSGTGSVTANGGTGGDITPGGDTSGMIQTPTTPDTSTVDSATDNVTQNVL
ncbi:MAG TPA: hypothetical protein VJ998_02975, partial [Pseudomonadales bacterium]|nr:hypothetical protein [Pseudomonadales bacterium]